MPRPVTPASDVTASSAGVVGTSGGTTEEVTARSTMGALARAEVSAAANTVKVIVRTIRPSLVFGARPAVIEPSRVADATPAAPTAGPPAVSPATQQSHSADAQPASRIETREFSVAAAASVATNPANARPGVPEAPPIVAPERTHIVPDGIMQPDQPSDERLVGAVLQQYRAAYERLDVTAAQSVWPTVDARALGAAFRQLAGQRVTFESCGVSVSGSGAQATARCHGQAEYLPKAGSRRAYVASGEWVFDLAKQDTAWRIINAEATIK